MSSPGLEVFVDKRPNTDRELIDGGAVLLPSLEQVESLRGNAEVEGPPYSRLSHDNELLESGNGGAMLNVTPEQVDAARNEMNADLVPRLQETTQRLAGIVDLHWKNSGIPAEERARELEELGVMLPDDNATDTSSEN